MESAARSHSLELERQNSSPLDQLEVALAAPNGLKSVRSLILGLALSGRLVSQNPKEGTGQSVVAEISKAREALIRARILSRRAYDETPTPPDSIPRNWAWARLGDIVRDCGQGVPTKQFTYIDVGSIDNTTGTVTSEAAVIEPVHAPSRARKRVEIGSVIYSTVRPYLLNVAVIDSLPNPAPIVSTAFAVLHPLAGVEPRFLFHVLRSSFFIAYVADQMKGVAYPAINDQKLYSAWVPLPPPAEQKRIVAKVDQLMALCDALEGKQAMKREVGDRLTKAALAALTSAETPEDFKAAWKVVSENFETILLSANGPDQLRQTIRQLAVMGRLVPQDPTDKSLELLLAQLSSERDRRHRRSPAPAANETARPALPTGWCWVLAKDITAPGTTITYGIIKPVWVAEGVPTIRVKDIQRGEINVREVACCAPDRADRFKKTRLSAGDLVIAKDGATLGKTAFVPPSLDGANVTQHVLRFPIHQRLSADYVRLVVDAPHGQRWMRGETRGVALPGVNVEDFRRMPIPLPPVAEQKRIVATVAKLMALCDDLKLKLGVRAAKAGHLAEALAASAASSAA